MKYVDFLNVGTNIRNRGTENYSMREKSACRLYADGVVR